MRKVEYFLIVIVCIFAAFISPIFNKEHTVELGSTSDIVSAFCNIVMAGAAVYAALKAVDWFNEKRRDLAFDKAISTSVEFDRVKLQIDVFHNNLLIKEKESTHKELHSIAEVDLKTLHLSILTLVRLVRNCERFGFDFKSEIKTKITESFSSYHNAVYKFNAMKNASLEQLLFDGTHGINRSLFTELKAIHKQTDIAAEMMNKSIDEIFDFKSR